MYMQIDSDSYKYIRLNITPEWIKSERYEYCENFMQDYLGKNSDKKSLAQKIKEKFNK